METTTAISNYYNTSVFVIKGCLISTSIQLKISQENILKLYRHLLDLGKLKLVAQPYNQNISYKISGAEATFLNRTKLKSFQAKYNPRLKNGSGWILKASQWPKVKQWLLNLNPKEYEVEIKSETVIKAPKKIIKKEQIPETPPKKIIEKPETPKITSPSLKKYKNLFIEISNDDTFMTITVDPKVVDLFENEILIHPFLKEHPLIETFSTEDPLNGNDMFYIKASQKVIHKILNIFRSNDYKLTIHIAPTKVQTEVPTLKELNHISEFLRKDQKDYERFRGNFVMEWGWLFYLQNLYPSSLVCTWRAQNGEAGIRYSWISSKHFTKGIIIQPWFLNSIKNCLNKTDRFVIGILALKVKGGHHANALIFDKKNNTLSRFEPHGSNTKAYNYKHADESMKAFLNRKDLINKIGKWHYLSSTIACPTGPQTKEGRHYYQKKMGKVFGRKVVIEAGGFCAAWSLIFIHYKLLNPDVNDEDIIEYMLNMSAEELSVMIREYVAFIVNAVDLNWATKENKDKIEVDDYVEFRNKYGVIVKKKPKNALILFKFNPTNPIKSFINVPYQIIKLLDDEIKIKRVKEWCSSLMNLSNLPVRIKNLRIKCD